MKGGRRREQEEDGKGKGAREVERGTVGQEERHIHFL